MWAIRFTCIWMMALTVQISTASASIDSLDTGKYFQQQLADVDLQLSPQARILVADILVKRQHSLSILFEQIQAAARAGYWDSEIFFNPEAFDALLLGYVKKIIDKDSFLDLYNFVEVVYQFGKQQSEIPGASVTRVQAKKLGDELISEWYSAITNHFRVEKTKLTAAFNALPDEKRYFTVIDWPCEECLAWPNTALIDGTPSQRLGGYLRLFSELGAFPDKVTAANKVILPPFSLIDAYRKLASSLPAEDIVNAVPTLGFHDIQAIRTMRENLQHPLQLYHPDLSNLLYPHQLYAGTLAGRHDFYHLMILSFIPADQQRSFYFMYDVDQTLKKALNSQENHNENPLIHLEKEFLEGMRYLVSGEDQNLQRIYLRLTKESGPPLWLEKPHDFYSPESEDNDDDDLLDLDIPDYVGSTPSTANNYFLVTWLRAINQENDTTTDFLHLNYQLFRSYADIQKNPEERLCPIPVVTAHQQPLELAAAYLASWNASATCLIETGRHYQRGFLDATTPIVDMKAFDSLYDYLEEWTDMESLMLLMKFWRDWLQGVRSK